MNELDKFLPPPPQIGPPLPSILKAYWPWVKSPPSSPPVLAVAETAPAPELVTSPAPKPAPVPAATRKTINYEVECPPEILSAGIPTRVSPGWIRI